MQEIRGEYRKNLNAFLLWQRQFGGNHSVEIWINAVQWNTDFFGKSLVLAKIGIKHRSSQGIGIIHGSGHAMQYTD